MLMSTRRSNEFGNRQFCAYIEKTALCVLTSLAIDGKAGGGLLAARSSVKNDGHWNLALMISNKQQPFLMVGSILVD